MTTLAPANSPRTREISPAPRPIWRLIGSATVHADRKRIFSALTLPEYMEAWISLPGAARDNPAAVYPIPRGFRINGSLLTGKEIWIEGRYVVQRRGKIIFSWEDSIRHALKAIIAIRLLGDFDRTDINVMYSDMTGREESGWIRDFWQRSLDRLDLLFRPSSNRSEHLQSYGFR